MAGIPRKQDGKRGSGGLLALLDMGVFLMILFLGLIYTWNQGGLKRL